MKNDDLFQDSENVRSSLVTLGLVIFIPLLAGILLLLLLNSCTITQTMVHTEGTASDVVDETETTSPDIHPTTDLSIPLKGL